MMSLAKISTLGRPVARSVLVAAGLALAILASGCGKAASEPRIDQSIPEVDPAALAAEAADSLETGAASQPEADQSPAE